MACSFSARAGSLEKLMLRQRCGARPCSFQIPCTVETPRPATSATARAAQRVASCGGGLSVISTTFIARSSGNRRLAGRPGLVAQKSFDALRQKRSCHRHTVVFANSVAAMIAFVPTPAALSSTIRAR